MSLELGEITKYHVASLYGSLFSFSLPGSNTDLTEIANSPLTFYKSKSGEHIKLFTGIGALFSSWRNSRRFLVLNMNNTDYGKSEPHPLFYAGLFIDEAMHYYNGNGKEVCGIDDIWEPGSVNYKTYWHLINSGYDTYTATINTWTGQMACRYSFPILQYPRNEFIDGEWVLTAKFGKI